MKISHLQEGSEASMPTPGQIPMHSARDPKVLETSAGASGSGSVATVSSPIGSTISRNSSIYGKTPKGSMLKGIKTSKKYANSAHVNESHLPLSKIDPPDHGEPEGDFVKNQLHTIKRVVTQLERIIGNNEDLPEWVEMKVSQAQGMMVSIMQYMVSAKEREVERHTGIEGLAEAVSPAQRAAIAIAKKKKPAVAEGYDDEPEECWTCRGTGEGQYEGQVCSNCHGSGVEPVERDDDDFDEPWDHGIFEDVIDEEVLAKKLAYQLQMFKRGKDKDLSGKPKAKDLGRKPVYSNTLESKSKGSLPGAVSGIKIMSPEEFIKSVDDEEVDENTNFMSLKSPMKMNDYIKQADILHSKMIDASRRHDAEAWARLKKQYEELKALAKKGMIPEATKLPAQQRELGGQEFQDYMGRIKGTDDIDKKTGQVKVDKKGNTKYTTGKTKTDKYKMPYVHRSSAIEYLSSDGKSYSEDAIKKAILQRPKSLLKQNEKMKHSNGELEQFFNVGFAALTGIAVDESTGKLIIVNTCPGAGSCKVDCFAMKGGKIQFKAAWLSDARILTYLLNDPTGFFSQLSSEISKEEKLGDKGGYTVTIRWHDAGDFFSPEYQELALKMADKHPGVKFYAYTKMADAVLADKPGNFIINWSEGAHTSQEKKVKANDASLDTTKNSRIVPTSMFDDLLIKDEKGNLKKGNDGQWQIQHDKLPELKERLAKAYGISANSILSYREWEIRGKKNPSMKWNVIVAPGEPDLTANDSGVLSTLLLRH
jgi:cytochrome c5